MLLSIVSRAPNPISVADNADATIGFKVLLNLGIVFIFMRVVQRKRLGRVADTNSSSILLFNIFRAYGTRTYNAGEIDKSRIKIN